MAPSGDNCQPWRFVVRGNEILVSNIPERDQSLYSWGQRASYFAHGALLENMVIAARALGYAADLQLFPDAEQKNLTARIHLAPIAPSADLLYDAIARRATNRKPYRNAPLAADDRSALTALQGSVPGAKLLLVEDPENRRLIAHAASANEEILFSNERMHRFFFSHINWTNEEDAKKSIGFHIDTLELPPPVKPLFRAFKHWRVARTLSGVGLHRQIARGNAKNIYTTGSAHGGILVAHHTPTDFVQAGRLMERLWLTATARGLSVQPLAGITFLMQGILAGEHSSLTVSQVGRITSAYAVMKSALGASSDSTLVMAFRIGEAPPPSAHASRLEPEVRFA